MNEIKVKLLRGIIIIMVSGASAYIICKAFTLFFQSIDDIHRLTKIVKLVIRCL